MAVRSAVEKGNAHMFQVERTAKKNAEALQKKLTDKGVPAKTAQRAARKQEANEVKRGNAWIRKNVGLD